MKVHDFYIFWVIKLIQISSYLCFLKSFIKVKLKEHRHYLCLCMLILLHPTTFFIILYSSWMKRGRKTIFNHLFFVQFLNAGCNFLKSEKLSKVALTIVYTTFSETSAEVITVAPTPKVVVLLGDPAYMPPGTSATL